ncbi:MAG: hypothetical protein IPM27_00445 [Nitrosomonadales bacterium]|nr:hypothetical protein [Nitrosomonadales bacterium]
MQIKYVSYSGTRRPGLLQKIAALVVAVVLGTLALMFSALLLLILLFVAVVGGAYFWWKTREVRKQFRQMQAQMRDSQTSREASAPGEVYEGEIIEGEAIRVDEARIGERR